MFKERVIYLAEKLITIVQYYLGTNAERLTMSTAELLVGSEFYETDGLKYKWDGTTWVEGLNNVSSNHYDTSDTITRPDNITAYDALDVVGEGVAVNLVFANAGPSGGQVIINSISMRCDVNAVPSGMSTYRLHLYNAAPTAIADNTAYNFPEGDRAKYLGYVDIPTPTDMGDTLWSESNGLGKIVKLADGSTTLYGILQTLGAYTPTASIVKTVAMHNVGV